MTTEIHSRLWSVEDLAGYLHTTRHGVYKLVERRQIPHIRLGRKILFDPAIVRAWLNDHLVNPDSPDCLRSSPSL